jgi:hypothetical protein
MEYAEDFIGETISLIPSFGSFLGERDAPTSIP